MDTYLDDNKEYWEGLEYDRPNVDHDVFRFYGKILVPDFGLSGDNGERLLDFGCGQGSAVDFFAEKGFDAYGVDISGSDLEIARERYPSIADRFELIDESPDRTDRFFGGEFDVVLALQSLYYYSDTDLETRLQSLYDNLVPGGVIYASMMGERHGKFETAEPAADGLREVTPVDDSQPVYVNFTRDEEDLREKFHMFEPKHIGFYNFRFREDTLERFHHTFVGVKPQEAAEQD